MPKNYNVFLFSIDIYNFTVIDNNIFDFAIKLLNILLLLS